MSLAKPRLLQTRERLAKPRARTKHVVGMGPPPEDLVQGQVETQAPVSQEAVVKDSPWQTLDPRTQGRVKTLMHLDTARLYASWNLAPILGAVQLKAHGRGAGRWAARRAGCRSTWSRSLRSGPRRCAA